MGSRPRRGFCHRICRPFLLYAIPPGLYDFSLNHLIPAQAPLSVRQEWDIIGARGSSHARRDPVYAVPQAIELARDSGGQVDQVPALRQRVRGRDEWATGSSGRGEESCGQQASAGACQGPRPSPAGNAQESRRVLHQLQEAAHGPRDAARQVDQVPAMRGGVHRAGVQDDCAAGARASVCSPRQGRDEGRSAAGGEEGRGTKAGATGRAFQNGCGPLRHLQETADGVRHLARQADQMPTVCRGLRGRESARGPACTGGRLLSSHGESTHCATARANIQSAGAASPAAGNPSTPRGGCPNTGH